MGSIAESIEANSTKNNDNVTTLQKMMTILRKFGCVTHSQKSTLKPTQFVHKSSLSTEINYHSLLKPLYKQYLSLSFALSTKTVSNKDKISNITHDTITNYKKPLQKHHWHSEFYMGRRSPGDNLF